MKHAAASILVTIGAFAAAFALGVALEWTISTFLLDRPANPFWTGFFVGSFFVMFDRGAQGQLRSHRERTAA